MYRLAELIDKHAEELAHIESLDNGKPVFMSKVRWCFTVVYALGLQSSRWKTASPCSQARCAGWWLCIYAVIICGVMYALGAFTCAGDEQGALVLCKTAVIQ